jgi:hypothetical protein
MTDQPAPQEPPYDHQRWAYERQIEDARHAHDYINDFHKFSNEAAIKSGDLALRTAVLINGGAAVSVLAFIGGLASQDRIKISQLGEVASSLMWFATGVACAIGAMAFSYFTHYFMAGVASSQIQSFEPPYVKLGPKTSTWRRANTAFHVLAVVFGLASPTIFVVGMLDVRSAITHLENKRNHEPWSDDVAVPTFGPRLVFAPRRESLTGDSTSAGRRGFSHGES